MKKILLAILLALPVVALQAQDNLALGQTATASSANGDNKADKAVDGLTGTRWESESTDDQWWMVDLGAEREFDLIQVAWETAYAKSFRITAATKADLSDRVTIVERTGVTLSDLNQSYELASAVTARYVRFEGIERATPYGYSFYEFSVYKKTTPVLTTLTAVPAAAKAPLGQPVAISVTGRDQYGNLIDLPSEPVFTVSPADAGTVSGSSYTALKNGVASLTARVGTVAAEAFTIAGYEGANLASAEAVIGSNAEADAATKANAFDGNEAADPNWVLYPASDALDYEAWAVLDLGSAYDLKMVLLAFEGASSARCQLLVSKDNAEWTVVKTLDEVGGINPWRRYVTDFDASVAGVRYVKLLSTKAATVYGVKLAEWAVYGVPGDITDGSLQLYQADERGVVPLRGTLSGETAAALAAAEGTAFDLTRVEIPAAVTVTTQNPNALLIVTAEQKAQLGSRKNLLVQDGSLYRTDLLQLADGYDVCTALTIQADRAEYERSSMAQGLATVVLPFDCAVPDGVKAYELLAKNDGTLAQLLFSEVSALEAGHPYLLKGTAVSAQATGVTLSFTADRYEAEEGISMGGTFAACPAPTGSYVLGTDGLFHQTAASAVIPAFHAYVSVDAAASGAPRLLSIELGGETTGLRALGADRTDAPVFDLSGRRVASPSKGLYIMNGKKVVIK